MVKILIDQRRKETKEKNKDKVRRNKHLVYCPLKDTKIYEMRCLATINSPPCKHLGFKGKCRLRGIKSVCPKLPKETYEDGSQHGQRIEYGKCLKCADFDKESEQCKLREQKKQKKSKESQAEEMSVIPEESEEQGKLEDIEGEPEEMKEWQEESGRRGRHDE